MIIILSLYVAFATSLSGTESKDSEPIIVSNSDGFAMYFADSDLSVPVGRLEVDLSNAQDLQNVLSMDNISSEIKEYITYLSSLSSCNPNMIATIYSQTLLPETRASNTIYKTYNGMEMRTDQVIVSNISTGYHFRREGVNAKAIADSISSILFFIGGIKSTSISFGATLLDLYETAAGGNVVYTSASDFFQVELVYDATTQWTYGKYDGQSWYLGYGSQKVTVKKVNVHSQFVVNGVGTIEDTSTTFNKTIKSSAFDSPWSTAYYNLLSPVDEWVSYTIHDTTFKF